MQGTHGHDGAVKCDCLVLGAGVAGLTTARTLAETGLRVLLVEARERVGGRLLTVYPEGEETPVELGAEFIHGRPPELLALLDEAKLAYYEASGEQMRYEQGVLRTANQQDNGFFDLLEELDEQAPDQSFDEFLAERQPAPRLARRARQYVEGFNAADAARIGTRGLARQQAAEDSIEGDRSGRLVQGYTALAEYLRERFVAAGGSLVLGSPAASLQWQRGQVTAQAATGQRWVAPRAVVALPLGVLQARSLRFDPEPLATFAAADALASGPVMRLVLRFRSHFWAERAPGMRFLFTDADEAGLPSTWWTTQPHRSGLLTGWLGGPRALAAGEAELLQASSLRSLERIFSLAPRSLEDQLLGWHTHDWQQDPYSLGAYSYAPKGAGDASARMARPVEDTLFFAGEHTDTTGHPGTVHGAMRSGLRAADQVLASLVASGKASATTT